MGLIIWPGEMEFWEQRQAAQASTVYWKGEGYDVIEVIEG